jgi:hypothetical protein
MNLNGGANKEYFFPTSQKEIILGNSMDEHC